MNSGINFDIMYELSCGRVIVVMPPYNRGRSNTYYWVSDNGNLIECDSTGRCCGVQSMRIPWCKGYKFAVKEREFKNVVTNQKQ